MLTFLPGILTIHEYLFYLVFNFLNNAYAAFRLDFRLPYFRFDIDICKNAQAPLTAERRPSGTQRQAN